MKYTFTVPPTKEQGSYKGTCSDNYTETHQQNALADYNSARAHDGLDPVKLMPTGTKYKKVEVEEYNHTQDVSAHALEEYGEPAPQKNFIEDAAPEMLELLKDIGRWLEVGLKQGQINRGTGNRDGDLVSQIRAAIKKAQGEA